MKNLAFLFLVLISLSSKAADFLECKLLLATGEVIEGYGTLPSNQLLVNSIKFKDTKEGEERKISDDDINQAFYTLKNGETFLFERNNVIVITGARKGGVHTKSHRKSWMLLIFYHEQIMVYNMAQTYEIHRKGYLLSKSVDHTGIWADIILLLKRPNEECPTIIGQLDNGATIIGKEKRFRNIAEVYFENTPELVERIEKKKFKSDEVLELAKAYIDLL